MSIATEQNTKQYGDKRRELDSKIAYLKEQFEAKQQEIDSMNESDANWFENHLKATIESDMIELQITALEKEKSSVPTGYVTIENYPLESEKYNMAFCYLAVGIFGLTSLVAIIIYKKK